MKEELMTQFRHAAIALALVTGATAANAQTTVITQPVQTETVITRPAQTETVITAPAQTRTVVTHAPLRLSPTQRQTVYRTIVRERVQPAQATVQYRVGMRVPETAQLYAVPESVVTEVPVVRNYKYMVVNDRVVLVDPATSEVVDDFAD
jgi:Protein of unknown function (DUF1236)